MDQSFEEAYLKNHPRSVRFVAEHDCPRGAESGRSGRAVWGNDECCSYCGSLHPDLLMERIEAGTVELIPTDKSYKVYVRAVEGSAPLLQSFRGEGDPGGSDPSKWVWTTRDHPQAKFYFQHLTVEQKKRFVELMNAKTIKIGAPGHFYRLPFFVKTG